MIRTKILPNMSPKSNPPAGSPPTDPPEPRGERILESRELLGPREAVLIRHAGRLYRLRRTRSGKLILTA